MHTLFLRWYAPVVFQTRMEKLLWSLAFQPISNCCKYRSHSAGTVLIQQVPFSGLYFDDQVPSFQIRITVLFSTDLKRLVQPYWDFPRLYRYSKTFLRTLVQKTRIQAASYIFYCYSRFTYLTHVKFDHKEKHFLLIDINLTTFAKRFWYWHNYTGTWFFLYTTILR